MERTTIELPEALLERLRRIATERNTTLSAVIAEALEANVDDERDGSKATVGSSSDAGQHHDEKRLPSGRPWPRSLGIGDSGRTDISRRSADDGYFEPRPWR